MGPAKLDRRKNMVATRNQRASTKFDCGCYQHELKTIYEDSYSGQVHSFQ